MLGKDCVHRVLRTESAKICCRICGMFFKSRHTNDLPAGSLLINLKTKAEIHKDNVTCMA